VHLVASRPTMADEIKEKIVAVGEEIRQLKQEKKPIDEHLAILKTLKAEYEAVAGTPYDPPPAAKKEKKPESTPTEVVREGPSKKELNKLAKKEARAAYKDDGASSAPKAAAAVAAASTSGGGGGGGGGGAGGAMNVVAVFAQPAELARSVAAMLGVSPKSVSFSLSPTAGASHQPILATGGGADSTISGDACIARFLARHFSSTQPLANSLYGSVLSAWELSQVDMWLDLYTGVIEGGDAAEVVALIEKQLAEKTFLVGQTLTLADVACVLLVKKAGGVVGAAVTRWLNVAGASVPALGPLLKGKTGGTSASASASSSSSSAGAAGEKEEGGDEGGSCPPLVDAVEGQVVTRFPPEPSGYLHIGHAKAVLLNQYYANRCRCSLSSVCVCCLLSLSVMMVLTLYPFSPTFLTNQGTRASYACALTTPIRARRRKSLRRTSCTI